MMTDRTKEPAVAKSCAESLKLDWSKISACVSGPTGHQLLQKSSDEMSSVTPKVTHAPDIRIEGKQYQGSMANILKEICSLYTGTKPKGCSSENISRWEKSLRSNVIYPNCSIPEYAPPEWVESVVLK
eukprot:g2771.t1